MNRHVPGLLAIVLCLQASACGNRDLRLTFIVNTPSPVATEDTLFIAGSVEQLGAWRPDGFALTRVDSTTWRRVLHVSKETPLAFKVTRGSWSEEALLEDGSIPEDYSLVVTADTTIRIHVGAWKDDPGALTGGVTGTVEYLRQLEGEGIPSRDVIVWLPPGYYEDSSRHYPVLYAHDGQNLFDPVTSFGGVDWQLDEHADSLSRSGRMREIIMVGVYNTPNRSNEYNVSDDGLAYLDFLTRRLKPRIDSTYRTLTGREHTGVMGSSMGGTISFLALWKYPHVFSRAACLSPYFPNSLPARVSKEDWDIGGLRLYIDNGDDELDSRLQKGVDRMLPELYRTGFSEGSTLMWFRAIDANHNEKAWAERVWRPLLFMFGPEEA